MLLVMVLCCFSRAAAAVTKRPENILLKRPPVSRASASQDGLSDMNSDAIIRVKNPASAVSAEGVYLLSMYSNYCIQHM